MNRLFVTSILAFIGCCPERLSPKALEDFISDENNGYYKRSRLGKTETTVIYRPTDLLVLQEAGSEPTAVTIDSLRKKYSQYYYFILRLSCGNKEALHQAEDNQYSYLVNTLSFGMSDFVTMTTSENDTIPVSDFVLNRTYGISSGTDLLFAFERRKAINKEWVQFNLGEFGLGTGNQYFRFLVKALERAPKIKFEKIR